ncbi:uncharacterized protein [Euwallacea similis]|uniref:uncharacterized protein n=1 Tax=Euwallacea similis TaxID=1736056 RepID=UPI00344DF67D
MKYFIILAIVLLTTSNARSDPCVPENVEDISLDSNFHLTWTTPASGCAISEFIVDIYDITHNIVYTYTVNDSEVDLPFLQSCQNYTFDIRAISNYHVAGLTVEKNLFTSISKDANLGISLHVMTDTTEALTFTWELEDDSLVSCVASYDVTYFNEESDPKTISQTDTNFTIYNPLPCMNYTIQVNAEVKTDVSAPIAEESIRTPASEPPRVPELNDKKANTTFADLTFNVPLYHEYRCEFSLVVLIIGMNYEERYKVKIDGDSHRKNPITVHVVNLTKDYVYDVFAWLENEAGKSNNITFLLQTTDKILES